MCGAPGRRIRRPGGFVFIWSSPCRTGLVRTRRWRLLLWLLGLVGVGFALKFLTGFPWRVTFTALLEANPWLLAIALVAHLSSLVAKGWGWHLILRPVAAHRTMGRGGRLLWPTVFALYNWAAQWATYHLVLRATHVPVPFAASFTALIAANLSGLLRPTPANVGVTQAALVVGLLPFGVAPEQAVAAGLALQGLQVLPVLLLGAMVTGWRLLKLETELA